MVFVVALVTSLILTPLVAVIATRLGIIDRPGPLKVQTRPVPYLGGVAVFLALTAGLASTHPRLLVPLGLALAAGVLDDTRPQPVSTRLCCQIVVGAAAGWAVPIPVPAGGAVTAVAAIGLLNAMNLLDGLDGLAGGVALVSAAGFALLGTPVAPALALMGALAGFLVFNRRPARIYLGDGGAYVVGTALALLAALAIDADPDVATWAAIPLLVAVPVLDTIVAFVRRFRAHRPVFSGDRAHVYDQLVDRARSENAAVLSLVLLQAALVALALWVADLDAGWAVAVTGSATIVLAAAVAVGGFVATPDASGAS